MSERNRDYKGSSRSTRDDSRRHAAKRRERTRSRSRSPKEAYSPTDYKKSPDRRSLEKEQYYEKTKHSPNEWEESEEEVPAPPPPPRISKISIDLQRSKAPIKMTLGGPAKQKTMAAPKPTLASVFNADDDDDEPEEMPAEARMRMRNIGRETPTSAGPNSFGKTKQGFCDAKKVFEKNLKHALETVEKPNISKLPQTIYKLKQ